MYPHKHFNKYNSIIFNKALICPKYETVYNKGMSKVSRFNELYYETVDKLSKYIHFKVSIFEDGQDIIQNVYKDYFNYVIKKNKTIDHPLAYLKQMVDKECARYYKKKSIKPLHLEDETAEYIADEKIHVEIDVLNQIVFEEVWKEIKNLSELDQQILGAYFRFDMSFKEISEELKISENAVRLRFYRNLKKIKEILTQKGITPSLK